MDYPEKPKRKPREKTKREPPVYRRKSGSPTALIPLMLVAAGAVIIAAYLFGRDRDSNRAIYETRIADYTATLADDPNHIDAYIDRGFAYRNLGNYEQANADFRQAIEIEGEGKNFRPLVGLGMVQESLGNYEAALEYHQQALTVQETLGDSQADPFYRIGNVLNLMHETDLAILSYQRSIEADPDYPNGYMGLANIYYKQKQWAAALENYERYVDIQGADSYSYILDHIVELRKKLGLHDS